MGFVGKALSGLFGKTEQFKARAPAAKAGAAQATGEAVETGEEIKKKTRARRANLFATQGGVAGEELGPGQIARRSTLLGN